ncbi:O-antigen ligase family protein [Poseidonibacter ostreae]|uniref:O-antigen ligase family protein n=1 Tax=Poseidonibacter ostreae TaxID=2654171 RepID=UPI001D0330AE|nr:O-antigen ligase family protein [Poseidonibacter ostreae]
MGYYLIHALILNRLSFNNKIARNIIIVGGLLSTSLAFFISLVLYLAIENIKNIRSVFLTLLIILIVFIIYENNKNDTVIGNYIYKKFELRLMPDDEGDRSFQGNNREDSIIQGYNFFIEKPIFGYGLQELHEIGQKYEYDRSSFMGILVQGGIVGFVFHFLVVLYMVFLAFKTKNAMLIGVLLLNYIQRPGVNALFIEIIILTIILYLQDIYKERKNVIINRNNKLQ